MKLDVPPVTLTTAPAPASLYDTLDGDEVMAVLKIRDKRTLTKLVTTDGLPCHRIGGRRDRVFIRGEVLDWLKSRCTSPAPDQKAG